MGGAVSEVRKKLSGCLGRYLQARAKRRGDRARLLAALSFCGPGLEKLTRFLKVSNLPPDW